MESRICPECGGDVPGTQCVHCGRYFDQIELTPIMGTDMSIIVILDRSGSMAIIKQATIDGFNEFLREQKELGGDIDFTLVQFDDLYEVVYKNIRLADAPTLDGTTYVPRGWTALYDAIGRTIGGGDPGRKTICVILTDGEENSSKEWTQVSVFGAIEKLKEGKWEFLFLGANQDAFATSDGLGIRAGTTASFSSSSRGTKGAFQAMSAYTASCRSGDAPQTLNDYYAEAMEDDSGSPGAVAKTSANRGSDT